jgi:HEAT repeat protein
MMRRAPMRTATLVFLVALLPMPMLGLADADPLQPLIQDVRSADTAVALKAIKGLGDSGDIRAVPPLLAALRDERGVVRQYAVEALQHLVRTLDNVYVVAKRWLQSLIDQLRSDPSDRVITTAWPPLDLRAKKA